MDHHSLKTYRHDNHQISVPKNIIQHFMHVINGPPCILLTCSVLEGNGTPPLCNFSSNHLKSVHIPLHALAQYIVMFLSWPNYLITTTSYWMKNLKRISIIYIFMRPSTSIQILCILFFLLFVQHYLHLLSFVQHHLN